MSNGRAELDGKLYGRGLVAARQPEGQGLLKQRLIIPPFSVLNSRDDVWQTRRRGWLRLGIESEVGRKDGLTYKGAVEAAARYTQKKHRNVETALAMPTTSVFDPVLCELCYRWFAPPAGIVIDPFAGGSVRGIVASVLGLKYWGCDLRQEQVAANKAQLNARTCGQYKPRWVCGDSFDRLTDAPMADFILSCPPYGDLEKYSDDPADISAMPYVACVARYAAIIARAAARLRPDRFACLVVANYRERDTGLMRPFVGDTITACEAAGLAFYNDAVLVNSVGTGAMRTNTNFARGARKLVKLHQNVLVFVKGDPKLAAAACGPAPDGKELDV